MAIELDDQCMRDQDESSASEGVLKGETTRLQWIEGCSGEKQRRHWVRISQSLLRNL